MPSVPELIERPPSFHTNSLDSKMKPTHLKVLFATCAVALLIPATMQAAPVNPKAIALLKRSCDTLAATKAFTYKSSTTFEVPAKNGQFLTLFSIANVALDRPNKIRSFHTGEAPHFSFFYDGATATAYAPATNVYSIAKAPPTIDAMLSGLEKETGIRFATAPLLLSNPFHALTKGLTNALYVGPTTIRGIPCDHLAFRGDGVNWEVWIESGARALPQRLAVTFTDRTNYPRTLVEFTDWNLHPWLKSSDFTFQKPAKAREIPFVSVLKSADR